MGATIDENEGDAILDKPICASIDGLWSRTRGSSRHSVGLGILNLQFGSPCPRSWSIRYRLADCASPSVNLYEIYQTEDTSELGILVFDHLSYTEEFTHSTASCSFTSCIVPQRRCRPVAASCMCGQGQLVSSYSRFTLSLESPLQKPSCSRRWLPEVNMTLVSVTFCTALYVPPHCIIFGGCVPWNKNLVLVARPGFESMSLSQNEWDLTAPQKYFSTSPNKLVLLGAETKGHHVVSDAWLDLKRIYVRPSRFFTTSDSFSPRHEETEVCIIIVLGKVLQVEIAHT